MTDTIMFGKELFGREITFDTGGISSWIIDSKIGDKVDDQEDLKFQNACGAYGTFLCHEKNKDESIAVIKIFLQVPYPGSEYGVAERVRQATETLTRGAQEQLDALRILTENHCTSTPTLLAYKIEPQPDSSRYVPGGFSAYLLIEYIKSLHLSKSIFWSFNWEDRENIRQGFEAAWKEAHVAGIVLKTPGRETGLEHIFYDPNSKKVTLTGFYGSKKINGGSDTDWSHLLWLSWGLANLPPDFYFNVFDAEPGMGDWET